MLDLRCVLCSDIISNCAECINNQICIICTNSKYLKSDNSSCVDDCYVSDT